MDDSIQKQFQISLQWKEPRATFWNLKKDTTLNALTVSDKNNIWLPRVVYENTDQKEVTRLGMPYEWDTTVAITREEESPKRSGMGEIDEIEYFQGSKNRLTMNQTYTWEFQCQYVLQRYPFDTQVRETQLILILHFCSAQECKIEMTVDGFSNDQVKLFAKQVVPVYCRACEMCR